LEQRNLIRDKLEISAGTFDHLTGKLEKFGNFMLATFFGKCLRCHWTFTGNILIPTVIVCYLEPVDILELADNLKIIWDHLLSLNHHLIKK